MGGYVAWVGATLTQRRCEMCKGTGGVRMQHSSGGCLGPLLWFVAGVVVVCFLLGKFVLPQVHEAFEPGTDRGSGDRAQVTLGDLAMGECFVEGTEPYVVRRASCATGHDGEVLARFEADTSIRYSDQQVDAECQALFSAAVQEMLTRAELRTSNMWDVFHDEIVCVAVRGQGTPPLSSHLP